MILPSSFIRLINFWIKYDVEYTIVLVDYLQVIHMKTPFWSYAASNSVRMISTLVVYLVLKFR